jgi:hypothetical protein
MPFLTICEPHPKLRAIFGGGSLRELARSIWVRRITKATLERSPASRLLLLVGFSFAAGVFRRLRKLFRHKRQEALVMKVAFSSVRVELRLAYGREDAPLH